jgi:hypothetical protein
MTYELWEEITRVNYLATLVEEAEHAHRLREFLLRRAAAFDAFATTYPDAADAGGNALRYAEDLRSYDAEHGTSNGNAPASDPKWRGRPREYARQEAAAWPEALRPDVHITPHPPTRGGS